MNRILGPLAILVVLLTACGGSDADSPATGAPATTAAPARAAATQPPAAGASSTQPPASAAPDTTVAPSTSSAASRAAPKVCGMLGKVRAGFAGVEKDISEQGWVTSLQIELVELDQDEYGAVVDGSADAAIATACPTEFEEYLDAAGRSTLLGIDR